MNKSSSPILKRIMKKGIMMIRWDWLQWRSCWYLITHGNQKRTVGVRFSDALWVRPIEVTIHCNDDLCEISFSLLMDFFQIVTLALIWPCGLSVAMMTIYKRSDVDLVNNSAHFEVSSLYLASFKHFLNNPNALDIQWLSDLWIDIYNQHHFNAVEFWTWTA